MDKLREYEDFDPCSEADAQAEFDELWQSDVLVRQRRAPHNLYGYSQGRVYNKRP